MLNPLKEKEIHVKIELLLKTSPNDALLSIKHYLDQNKSSESTLLLLAKVHFLNNDLLSANEVLKDIITSFPYCIAAYFELSKSYQKERLIIEAIAVLEQAIGLTPEYHDLWNELAQCHIQNNNQLAATNALKQYVMIKEFNDLLYKAEQKFDLGEYKLAEVVCRDLLDKVPNETRVLILLSKIAQKFNNSEMTLSILQHCHMLKPTSLKIKSELINALLTNKRLFDALSLSKETLRIYPNNITILGLQAAAEVKSCDYETALATYDRITSLDPYNPIGFLRYGNVLKILGDSKGAIKAYKAAIKLDPSTGEAYWNLSNLKTYAFSGQDVLIMEELVLSESITKQSLTLLQFSLGKALEDQGRYAESFNHYQQANTLCLKDSSNSSELDLAPIKSTFTTGFFKSKFDSSHQSSEPIFIVGLPRSGSTLVEQILASHSKVDGTAELTEITSIARDINVYKGSKGQYPQILGRLNNNELKALSERYLKHVLPMRQGSEHFIDKQPNNFIHIGLIKALFPHAKIIDVRRNPMASGWSLYKHFFAEGHQFSYDLERIGEYYNKYIEMMSHWNNVMPGEILTIEYEDLINEFDATVNKIMEYCSIELESGCLSFYKNTRPVATASSEQVRQPIYQEALNHWKNYEEFLKPLTKTLNKYI